MRKYTSKQDIENYNLIDIDGAFESQIENWIEAMSSYIEKQTNRKFIADDEASSRYYDGNGLQYLIIDDCVEVTKVEVGSDIWGDNFYEVDDSGTDRYYTFPTNNEGEELPIRKIGLRSRIWIKGHGNNRITAKWGYSASVPEDIKFAATIFVSGIINTKRDSGGNVKSEKIGQYSVTFLEKQYSDFEKAKEIINSYRRYYL